MNPGTDADFQFNAPLVGGERLANTSLGEHAHINPATGAEQARVKLAGAAEIDAAVRTAQSGLAAWRALGPGGRRDALLRLAQLVEDNTARFTRLAARESGVPVMMGGGVRLALEWIRYYAGWADKIEGAAGETASGQFRTRCEPYGVIGAIIPWNSPIVAMAMKVAPALAAGNAVVLKPPSLTPFAALYFGELALEAGLPPGALNVTPGDAEAGEALVAHPGVAKISFTGGGAVARRVMERAAQSLKPVALELGGKSANIIFADADLDAAAQMAAIHGVAVLSGQGCVLPTRVYVEDAAYDGFVERLLRVVGSLKVGDPLAPDTFMGPVISAQAADRIIGVIERAKAERAGDLLTGGVRMNGELARGAFIAPTVFGNVAHDSDLAREEIFGPVLAVTRFRDEADAVTKANDSRYGLGAYVHTKDIARGHRCADALQAGMVSINAGPPMAPNMPFGGYKQSGFGREGGRAGLDEFLQIKTIHVALPGAPA